jgi:hypothetical protein
MKNSFIIAISMLFLIHGSAHAQSVQVSGIYPHLAQYNNEGECGTGAVVAWAGKLWTISYGPHLPYGSSDRLYEIAPDISRTVRKESVGGTHANRMIHKESKQLFIGYHVIDEKGNVRTIDPNKMPGRLTGLARSINDPANKIIYATMEEGFYEVDVHTPDIKMLFKDGNQMRKEGANTHESPLLPGVHGKGFYSGQGVYVYSNNGEAGAKARVDPTIEAGSLSEWDGKNWKLIRRNQFVEVTGPGGIYGNNDPLNDPIWATGWDHRSAMIGVRYQGKWNFYRLPKASNSYDGAHGWNTEWPRIRDIGMNGKQDLLMTLHGMFWRFPATFQPDNTKGIRARSSYLKVIGDFERWNDKLVFGCDDATKSEFLSNRPDKAGIPGAGQSHSNLWFTDTSLPDQNAPIDAYGSIYQADSVKANVPSEPFLFAGWSNRTIWVKNHGGQSNTLTIEIDLMGNGKWTAIRTIELKSASSAQLAFPASQQGEWIRVRTSKSGVVSFSLAYTDPKNKKQAKPELFKGFVKVGDSAPTGSILYALNASRKLGLVSEKGDYYEMDSTLQIRTVKNQESRDFLIKNISIPKPRIQADQGSYLIVDTKGRRWRLPFGNEAFTSLMENQKMRLVREVVTERDLLHLGGTFYELPAENADGYAKLKPISSHNLNMNDFASYRGMLLISGANANVTDNQRIVKSEDGQIAVWAGTIDDLWKLGKPVGKGSPWLSAKVSTGDASDPYLLGGYDERKLTITNHGDQKMMISLEIDPTGNGEWFQAKTFDIAAHSTITYLFPTSLQGKWLRFRSLSDGSITTSLEYK